jgi:hypothetical protein
MGKTVQTSTIYLKIGSKVYNLKEKLDYINYQIL